MKYLLILTVLVLNGCGRSPLDLPAPGVLVGGIAPTVGKIATSTAPALTVDQNTKDQIEARAQAEFWACRVKVEEDQGKRLVAAERQHWLEMTCRALMGLCVFGMLCSGFAFAASFIWPWFERLRYAAIAGVGAAVVLFVIAWYLPTQIFWIGISVAACTVGGVIMLFQHGHVLGKAEKLSNRDLNKDGKIG